MMVLQRLDDLLLGRVFQPVVDRMAGNSGRIAAAEFFLTGAMVLLLARMTVSAAGALPGWTVLFDLAALWAAMAIMPTLSLATGTRFNPLRERFRIARRVLACLTVANLVLGAWSTTQLLATMETALWCIAFYFASCDAPTFSPMTSGRKVNGLNRL